MIFHRTFLSFIAAGVLLVAAGAAQAACPRIPENNVWGQVGSGAVAGYVERAYKGDWAAYIKKWETRLANIEGVSNRGAMLVFHKTDLRLSGDQLKNYINDVRSRLAVTRCLARSATQQKNPGATVAGTPAGEGS